MTTALTMVGIAAFSLFLGWWYWYWLDFKSRPEVRARDRRRRDEEYRRRMSNPKYRKRFER